MSMKYTSGIVISYLPDLVPMITVYGIYFVNKETQTLNTLYKDTVYEQQNLNSSLTPLVAGGLNNMTKDI